jgi:HSP20 family molecular chaperone IbpA
MNSQNEFQAVMSNIFSEIFKELTIANGNYPPVNIIQVDDLKLKLEIGAIGFKKSEIDIEHDPSNNRITVTAKKSKTEDEDKKSNDHYILRKLSKKNFVFPINAPDYTEIESCFLEDGLLTIDLYIKKPKDKEIKKIKL